MDLLKCFCLITLLSLTILLTSCPNNNDPALPQCEKRWFANKKNLASINNGNLELQCSTQDSVLVITTFNPQSRKINLQGDFEINVNFESFYPGIFNSPNPINSGAFDGSSLKLFISSSDKINNGYISLSKKALMAFTTNKKNYFNQYVAIDSMDAIKPGHFNIKRTGTLLKFSSMVGTKSYSLSDDQFGNADAYFLVSLSCFINGKMDHTSIKLNDFNIVGGGGTLKSDTFDCNSFE